MMRSRCQFITLWKDGKKTSNLSHKIGMEKSSIITYDKVILISIPLNEKELLLISAEPSANYFQITNKTFELLKDFKNP